MNASVSIKARRKPRHEHNIKMKTMNTASIHSLKRSFCIGIVILAASVLADPLWAAPPPQVVIQRMDRDGDGRISADEWLRSPQVFQRIDGDNDGYVTLEELIDFRAKRAGRQPGNAAPAPTPGELAATDNKPKAGWTDVHFHLVANKEDLEGFDEAARRAIQIMDEAGIGKIIAMSPPRPRQNFDFESISGLAKKYSARIAILGGGGTLNPMIQAAGHSPAVSAELRNRFKETAEKIIASGAKGFGEMTAHHVSLSPSHGYEGVPADHSLFLLLADIAAQHNVPIDMHFDPVPEDAETPSHLDSPKNPPILKENIKAFERLLSHNRSATIVWAHAGSDPVGWYTPELVQEMLAKHRNLFFSIRPVNRPDTNPVWNPKTGINHDWISVFKRYPDRFVLGTDSFVVSASYTGQAKAPLVFEQRTRIQRQGVNELLSSLDEDLARKIGHENAERIYRLNE